jgi:hypothetical protein
VKWSAAIQAKRNFEVSADAERVATENLREAEINLALKQAATVQAKLAAALILSICIW